MTVHEPLDPTVPEAFQTLLNLVLSPPLAFLPNPV
jgi:hypothetical protein